MQLVCGNVCNKLWPKVLNVNYGFLDFYLVVYLEVTLQAFREQKYSLERISAEPVDWSKAQIVNILAWRPKMKKIKVLYFL